MKYRLLLTEMTALVLALAVIMPIATHMSNILAQEVPTPVAEQPPANETHAPATEQSATEQPASASPAPQLSPEVSKTDVPKITAPADGFIDPISTQVLAYNAYSQLAATQENANFCFSPPMLAKQLTALRFGADGASASEIVNVYPTKVPVAKAAEFLRMVETNAAKLPEGVKPPQLPPTFGSANAIWVPQDHPIVEQYISGLKTGLATELYAADFKNNRQMAATIINAWSRDKTGGRLVSIFAEPYETSLPGDISVVMTGLVCASPRLAVPFNRRFSEPQEFQLLSGEKISVPMMRQVGQYYGAYDKNLQVLVMPCVEENLRLVVLLPAQGQLATLEKSMTPEFLARWFGMLKPMTINVVMPQVQTTSCLDLVDVTKKLGMSTIASDKADLSNMSQAVEKGPLQLSKLMHETQVNIVEQTDVAQQLPQTQGGFYVNRPFMYLIWDAKSNVPLVIGRITDPRQ